jgi:hypothetical protein
MTMSTVVKLMIGIVTGVLVLGTLAWWAFEREYGGQDAVRDVAVGVLPEGAEVRDVPWASTDPEGSADYEVVDEGGLVVVRFVDRGGAVLFSGTGDEVTAWLDEQGPQLFVGTYAQAVDYRQGLQDEGTSGFPVWLVPIWFVPILTAIVAARREEKAQGAGHAVAG